MRENLRRFRHASGIPGGLVFVMVLLSAAVTDLIDNVLSATIAKIVWIAVLTIWAVVLFRQWNTQYDTQRAQLLGQPGTAKVSRRRGLIVIVGLESDLVDSAMAKLLAHADNVEFIAFIGTPETAARGVVANIRSRLLPAAGLDLPQSHIRVWEHNNAVSVEDNTTSTDQALTWLFSQGVDAEEIVVDISAGRRVAGIAATRAADARNVEVQMLALEWDTVTNRPIPGREIFKVIEELYDDGVDTDPVLTQHLELPEITT